MVKIIPVALTVTGDEKAFGLTEIDEQSPGNKGLHRYQLVYVVRDGKEAEFRRDMGEAKNFRGVKYLIIPSLLELTVDELFDLADELRGTSKIDIKDWLELDNFRST